MAKRRFTGPVVTLMSTGGGSVVGPGSGQSTTDDDLPWAWEEWAVMFDEVNLDGNDEPGEWSDYVLWWQQKGFTDALFLEYNHVPIDSPNPPEP